MSIAAARKLGLLLCVCAWTSWGQDSQQQIAAPRVEGRVVDAATGAAVHEATVTICYEGTPPGQSALHSLNFKGISVTTGADGYFAIQAPEGIAFHLSVSKSGFITQGEHMGKGEGSRSFLLKDFDKHAGVLYKLASESALGGRITDKETGKPISNLQVSARNRGRRGGSVYWSLGTPATTDSDGRFLIGGLPPGEYRLTIRSAARPQLKAISRETAEKAGEPLFGYRPASYPGVDNFDQAASIFLSPGAKQEGLDVKLEKARLFRVRGEVRGEEITGPIKVQAKTLLEGAGWSVGMAGTMPEAGHFEYSPLPPGPIHLTAHLGEEEPLTRLQASVAIDVLGDVEKASLLLVRGSKIYWNVVPPRAGVTVDTWAFERMSFGKEDRMKTTDSEGRALFDGIFAEPLRVRVSGLPKGWIVKKYLYNDVAFDPYRFQIDPHAAGHKVQLEIAEMPNAIQGRVTRSDKTAAGAYVVAIAEPFDHLALTQRALRFTADAEGQYDFSNLLPGKWQLAAVDPSQSVEDAYQLLLNGKGQKCEVPESGSVALQLRID